jgi:hypothetical protein
VEFSKTASAGDIEVWTATEDPPEDLSFDNIQKITKEIGKSFADRDDVAGMEAISISKEAGVSVRVRLRATAVAE